MPPKPAAAAKSVEDDAADHEKEFVEKELIISFLKTRLSRYGSSRSYCVSYHHKASLWSRGKHVHHVAICLFMCVLVMLHNLLPLFMKPCAVSPSGQSAGNIKHQVDWKAANRHTLLDMQLTTFPRCRHQERGEVLLVENARLGQDLETQKLNLADINEFLTSELDKTSAKLIQLEDKAGKVQQRLDELVENHVVCQHSCAIFPVMQSCIRHRQNTLCQRSFATRAESQPNLAVMHMMSIARLRLRAQTGHTKAKCHPV